MIVGNANMLRIFCAVVQVVSDRTDRQTDMLITLLCFLTGGRVTMIFMIGSFYHCIRNLQVL